MRTLFASMVLWGVVALLGPGCDQEPVIDGKGASEWLGQLNSEDWTRQTLAENTLARLGKDALPYLKRGARGTDPTLRRNSVITMGKIGAGAKGVVPFLLRRIAREEVAVIRAEILRALALIDPMASGVKEELTKRQRDQDSEVQQAAKKALEVYAPPKQPSEEPKKPSSELKPEEQSFLLRDAVAEQIKSTGVAFGISMEVAREGRRAAVVWPAIRDNKIVDDDIVAYVFEKKESDSWALVEGNILVSKTDGPEKLAKALGGADKQQVIRPCGVAREKLTGYLLEKSKGFKDALAGGKADLAMKAYEELTQAFYLQTVAFEDTLPELLASETLVNSPWNFDVGQEGNLLPIEVKTKDKSEKGKIELRPCGSGWVIAPVK